ncbi:MAG: enoyl-CoA hydratase [Deltaproteobacteria bacterium]|nr:enoyl-CoA hydratase [Deltaproteobacteria bacterium]
MEPAVLFEQRGAVALITLNRPDRRNAMNQELLAGLYDAMERVSEDPSLHAAVLTGSGKAFCAGLDLAVLLTENLMDPRGDGATFPELRSRLQKPLVGAVNGPAITGGMELALNCDFLLGSTRALFADTHVKVGIHPGWGMSQLLQRRIGLARALQMSLTGEFVEAEKAMAWGLLNEVTEPADLLPRTMEVAGMIAANPPEMVGMLKSLMERGSLLPSDKAMELEQTEFRNFLQEKGMFKQT